MPSFDTKLDPNLDSVGNAVDTTGMFSTLIVLCTAASIIYTLLRVVERRSKLVNAQVRDL